MFKFILKYKPDVAHLSFTIRSTSILTRTSTFSFSTRKNVREKHKPKAKPGDYNEVIGAPRKFRVSFLNVI